MIIHSDPPERWRKVDGFNRYYVSDKGRVLSKKPGGDMVLKQETNSSGYKFVRPCENSVRHICFVHHLVASAFINHRPEGFVINHRNCDKLDNRASNLEYITQSDNIKHWWEHKRREAV